MAAAGYVSSAAALTFGGYLVVLAVAALRGRTGHPQGSSGLSLVVLIPAHDEAGGIAATVSAVLSCDYPKEMRRVVVIADNCTDATAAQALEAGAEAWERDEPDRRGKGHALAWGLERLGTLHEVADAIVFVDADCRPSANLLQALAAEIGAGADAAQARYVIADSHTSTAAGLRAAGFALMNVTRPLGKASLRLSAGLLGTGMAFATSTLEAVPWRSFSLAEDREHHLDLIEAGRTVSFASGAEVTTTTPQSSAGARTQETRWDAGNLMLARSRIPRLLWGGIDNRAHRVHAAFELTVPPQSVLSVLWAFGLSAGAVVKSRRLLCLALLAAGAQVGYVAVGLRAARVPGHVWRSLPAAPALVVRRLAQLARVVRNPPSSWERTDRGDISLTE
jgi:cellulose synthase/poly-beta-1,6-N-acetylglucosamine synthase-like glycosyltransferase